MNTRILDIIRIPCLMAGVLFFCLTISAQEEEGSSIFKQYYSLGLTSSQISGDNLSGFEQLGFNAAIAAEIHLNDRWRPRIEIQFDQRGSRKNARPDRGDFESYRLRLNYVQVPLIIGLNRGATGFELGLAPGYLLSSSEEDQDGSYPLQAREFEKYDLGGLAGIRYRFHEHWELCTRFEQSILKVRDHSSAASFRLNQGQYSSSIQFMLRFHV